MKPVHLHVTKTGQVQQIKITGARHAPLSPHVTEIVSVSACWRLDVIEIIFFRNRKYFFSPFLSGACILSPWVGTSPPFCTWIQIVIAPGPGHVITTGVRPKGAGGASVPPMKNISACRNENRATVGTGMKVLFGQKLEVC